MNGDEAAHHGYYKYTSCSSVGVDIEGVFAAPRGPSILNSALGYELLLILDLGTTCHRNFED